MENSLDSVRIYDENISLLISALQSRTEEVQNLLATIDELKKEIAKCKMKVDAFNRIFDLRYPHGIGGTL